MVQTEFHKIWQKQSEAAKEIKEHYGLENALAYLIGEKLINFAEAAEQRPEFAQELPAFAAEVRRLFSLQEIRNHFDAMEQSQVFDDKSDDEGDIDEDILNDHAQEQEHRQRVAWVKAMILGLGSSSTVGDGVTGKTSIKSRDGFVRWLNCSATL